MIKKLKHNFIPHKKNGYRPGILEPKNTRLMVGTLILAELALFLLLNLNLIANNSYLASVLPAVLSTLTNEKRQETSLAVLTSNPILDEAATLKAQDMAAKQYFAHTSPEGKKPWYWFEQVGYKYDFAGENLAIDFSDSVDVTNAWMNSPTHKANILKANYTEIGTGIATGTFEGKQTIFVAQLYASPAKAVVAKAPVTTTTATVTAPVKAVSTAVAAPATTTPESIKVLGEETINVPTSAAAPSPTAPTQPESTPSWFAKVATSPVHTGNTLFVIIASIIGLVLVATVVIEIRTQHFDLITNALAVIFIAIGFYFLNVYLSPDVRVAYTSTTEFSAEQI